MTQDRNPSGGSDYAGDVPPKAAWEMLEAEPNAVLVDVRTRPEWHFVGRPDLSALGKRPDLVEWVTFPGGTPNQAFVDQTMALAPDPETPVLFLCRSGQRSRAAAIALTEAGYARCYNIAEGFEGDKDAEGHRGRTGGWKVAGLPWVQD